MLETCGLQNGGVIFTNLCHEQRATLTRANAENEACTLYVFPPHP